MSSKWIMIVDFRMMHRAQIVKDFLEDNNINVVIVDKKDSAYQLGWFEVYVEWDNVIISKKLIADTLNF